MSTFTIQRTAVCAGGNHHTFTCIAGAKTVTTMLVPSDVTSEVTEDELRNAIAVILKAHKFLGGLTNNQLLQQAITGLTVTVST